MLFNGYQTIVNKSGTVHSDGYISGDPEKNLPKLLGFIESIGWDTNQTKVFHQIIDNPDNVWYRYLMDCGGTLTTIS